MASEARFRKLLGPTNTHPDSIIEPLPKRLGHRIAFHIVCSRKSRHDKLKRTHEPSGAVRVRRRLCEPLGALAMIAWLQKLFNSSNDVRVPEVSATDSGFRLVDGSHEIDVEWRDIVEIVAFQWLLPADEIVCLHFVNGADEFILVGEDFPGYDKFIKVVESRFTLRGCLQSRNCLRK